MRRQSEPSTARQSKKSRNRIACKRCHDRRVKCDVSAIGTPCTGCTTANLDSQCHVLTSKRARGDDGRFSCRGSTDALQMPVTPHESIAESVEEPTSKPSDRVDSLASEHQPQHYRDEADVWTKVVSQDSATLTEARRIMYVGEPWTLAYVMQWKGQGHQGRGHDTDNAENQSLAESPTALHVSVPMDTSNTPASHHQSNDNDISIPRAPNLPPQSQQALIDSYFSRHHTLYPAMNETNFRIAFRDGTVSSCLRYSVLYAGALHAADPVIYRAGFDSRQDCLLSLYRRAKFAYFLSDNERTTDQLSSIQSALLLHNMWEGPNATLDPLTWLGLAIRMAQNIGMHRSTQPSSLPASDKRLWKRLWWCLYTRDRQIASALGKPQIIRDEDCDVEPLTMEDFEVSDSEQTRHFVIQQAKLSVLYGTVMSQLFAVRPREPLQKEADRSILLQEIECWRAELPPLLSCESYRNWNAVPFPGLLLEALYHCLLLLVHRSRLQSGVRTPGTPQQASWKTTFEASIDAATGITRVTETIMNHGSLTDCPLFFTSALFSAMTIHAIRGRDAEQLLSLCMIAMRPLSSMYFAAGWIRNLFQKLNEKRAESARPTRPSSPNPNTQNEELKNGPTATNDMLNIPQQDANQHQLMDGFERGQGSSWPQFEAWPAGANINAFGLMSRNVGGFLDYSMMPEGGFGSIDPNLADYWQDILSTEYPFQ